MAGLLGALIGFLLTKKFFGAILGFIVGNLFFGNKVKGRLFSESSNASGGAYQRQYSHDNGYYRQRVTEQDFGTALLILSAAVMKADGKVLKSELDYVKEFFKRQFGPAKASDLIQSFKDILDKDFDLREISKLVNNALPYPQKTLIIQYLFGISNADGHVSVKEIEIISEISSLLGIQRVDFEQIKGMFAKDIDSAYKVLGIDKTATNDEIKRAYRKMAVQHHPDKYAQMGEEHQTAAKEKFQKIQEAYEQIKKEKSII